MHRSTMLRIGIMLLGAWASAPQARANTRLFTADLGPEDEMSPVESSGKGHADFELDVDSLKLNWTVNYGGLTSRPVAVTLNGPGQMGTVALPFLDMAGKTDKMPLKGSATVTNAQVQYMLSTWTYINIATERYKDGEIRGQLQGRGIQ